MKCEGFVPRISFSSWGGWAAVFIVAFFDVCFSWPNSGRSPSRAVYRLRFNRPSELKVRSRIPCRTAWCAAHSAGHFGSSQSVLVIKLPRSFIFIFGIFQSNFLFIVFSYCRQVRACGVSTDIRNLAALQAMFSYGFLDVFNVISVIHTENSQISIWLFPRSIEATFV